MWLKCFYLLLNFSESNDFFPLFFCVCARIANSNAYISQNALLFAFLPCIGNIRNIPNTQIYAWKITLWNLSIFVYWSQTGSKEMWMTCSTLLNYNFLCAWKETIKIKHTYWFAAKTIWYWSITQHLTVESLCVLIHFCVCSSFVYVT